MKGRGQVVDSRKLEGRGLENGAKELREEKLSRELGGGDMKTVLKRKGA